MILTICDPRIKENMYSYLRKTRHSEPEAHAFYMSNNYLEEFDKVALAFKNSENEMNQDNVLNMKDSYFRMQSQPKNEGNGQVSLKEQLEYHH